MCWSQLKMEKTRELWVGNKWGCSRDHTNTWSPLLQVNNLSPLTLAISVNFWVPILLNGVAVWDVTLRSPAQVHSP